VLVDGVAVGLPLKAWSLTSVAILSAQETALKGIAAFALGNNVVVKTAYAGRNVDSASRGRTPET
jgi:hypothetical protein